MYEKYILPYLLNYTCGQKPFIKQRQKLVPMAKGKVLEVGIGSGLNMPYLNTSNISSLVGIDPSEELIQIAEKRIDDSMPKIDFIISKAEEMKFDDSEPFSALAFKVANDPFVGSLTFIRIYSGKIQAGTSVYNSSILLSPPPSTITSGSMIFTTLLNPLPK